MSELSEDLLRPSYKLLLAPRKLYQKPAEPNKSFFQPVRAIYLNDQNMAFLVLFGSADPPRFKPL